MNNLLASRFANTPVLAADGMAEWFSECLAQASAELSSIRDREAAEGETMSSDSFWPEADSWRAYFRPYNVENGTLSIPIKGILLHDFGYQFGSYATGYVYIRKALERGLSDPAVQRIAMLISSGGGEVAGNFDLVDAIYARRGEKPITAFVDEHAYSAAYSLASVADKIIMPRTGGVGSVGVVTAHVDYSENLKEAGVKIQFIHAGEHKVDGNPYEPLPEEVKNRMQARIDGLYDIFTATVARNLGVDEQVVRDTEALTYDADEATSLGLAHEIRPIDEALAAFNSGLTATKGDIIMSEKEQQKTSAFTQADIDAARAEGRKEGASAERQRIQGILGCEEATARRELSFHLSMNTELSVDDAKGILAATPAAKEAPAAAAASAPGADFQAAMQHDNPDVGGEGGEGPGEELSAGDQLIRDYQNATGSTK